MNQRGPKTLDEFMDSYEATRLLRDNLKTNLDVMTDLSKEEKKALLRLQLIMVRQCLMDFGVE